MKEQEGRPEKGKKRRRAMSASFITGAIALVFLIVGYQVALFMNRAVRKKAASEHSADTVYVVTMAEPSGTGAAQRDGRRNGGTGSPQGGKTPGSGSRERSATGSAASGSGGGTERGRAERRPAECFEFDPNTAGEEDLQRLGFSQKQAQSILNYRMKGGRFRRPEDFARSWVVADSVYRRLEPYIRIPKIDLNTADSAAFTTLPGIGGYFARKMVEYREQLGGYSYAEQLMDINRFDAEKFAALEDLICVDSAGVRAYGLWTLPEDSLRLHPYIGSYAAHGIVVFRENNAPEDWTVEALDRAGILRPGMAGKLSRCRIAR